MPGLWSYGLSNESILQKYPCEVSLEDDDFQKLYRFYVLNSPCEGQSHQRISFEEYGWEGGIRESGLGRALDRVIPEGSGPFFLPRVDSGATLEQMFSQARLFNGMLRDTSTERAAAAKSSDSNTYLRLFRHVRNCFAHGRFVLVESCDRPDGVFIMEDRDHHNYTARMVLGRNTLLEWARIVRRGPGESA